MKYVEIFKRTFVFKKTLKTSNGILIKKPSYFIVLKEQTNPDKYAIGECSILPFFDLHPIETIEKQLAYLSANVNTLTPDDFIDYPTVRFAFEMALKDFNTDRSGFLFPSEFTKGNAGIPINGLVWMGDENTMKTQINSLISKGFSCIKLKIGTLDFYSEINLIRSIRKKYSKDVVQIRVDANGAFPEQNIITKLRMLADLGVHSIEQPVKAGSNKTLKELCELTPIPIALDESLIGIHTKEEKEQLLSYIKPQYIVLKPTLLGGFKASEEWIDLAKRNGVDWWVTSALESNIGLNAIAQWVYSLGNISNYQGLSTGKVYRNNINSPLHLKNDEIWYDPVIPWQKLD